MILNFERGYFMPTVTIRLSNKELNDIKNICDKKGLTISAYIKSKIFPDREKKDNFLTNEIIVKKIKERIDCKSDEIDHTQSFALSQLFDDEEYTHYYNFIPAGKTFFKFATTEGTEAFKLVESLGGKPAKYLIRKDVLKGSK